MTNSPTPYWSTQVEEQSQVMVALREKWVLILRGITLRMVTYAMITNTSGTSWAVLSGIHKELKKKLHLLFTRNASEITDRISNEQNTYGNHVYTRNTKDLVQRRFFGMATSFRMLKTFGFPL